MLGSQAVLGLRLERLSEVSTLTFLGQNSIQKTEARSLETRAVKGRLASCPGLEEPEPSRPGPFASFPACLHTNGDFHSQICYSIGFAIALRAGKSNLF